MGIVFTATTKSADAPDIEPGIYDAKCTGLAVKFVTGGQYGDGDRFEWAFTLLDDDGDVMYEDGDPVEINGLTSMSMNILSKTQPRAVRYLRALLTPSEYATFEAGGGVEEKLILGRACQVEVSIKDNGWPTIANVLPVRVKRAPKKNVVPETEPEEA